MKNVFEQVDSEKQMRKTGCNFMQKLGEKIKMLVMRSVTVQLSDPLRVWESIRDRSQGVSVCFQLRLPPAPIDAVFLL